MVQSFRILWSKELVVELNRILSKPDVELVISSTWQELALSDFLPAVGIHAREDTTVLFNKSRDATGYTMFLRKQPYWWKLDNVEKFAQELPDGDEVMWIDDDIVFYPEAIKYLDDNKTVEYICPKTFLGLTKKNISLLDEWSN